MIATYENYKFEGVSINLYLKWSYGPQMAISCLVVGATFTDSSGMERTLPWAEMNDVAADFTDFMQTAKHKDGTIIGMMADLWVEKTRKVTPLPKAGILSRMRSWFKAA